jgi:hypothetical protein
VLIEWNAAKGNWQEIAVHPVSSVNHITRGQAKGLGTLVLCLKTR